MPERRRPCQGPCGRNRAERFFTGPQGRICSDCRRRRVSNTARDARLQETYGISIDDYEALFAAQGGACAICGGRRKDNLDVDHCHKTGQIRGLLCKRCNRRLLPAALDKIEVLLRAIEYLKSPPGLEVLGVRIAPAAPKRRLARRANRR